MRIATLFDEPDGDAMVFTVASSDTGIVTASLVSVDLLRISAVNVVGDATVTVTATDPDGLSADIAFGVTVVSNRLPVLTGQAPTIQSTHETVLPGSSQTFNMANWFDDADNDELRYTAAAHGFQWHANIDGTLLTVSATLMASVTTTVLIRASDDYGHVETLFPIDPF